MRSLKKVRTDSASRFSTLAVMAVIAALGGASTISRAAPTAPCRTVVTLSPALGAVVRDLLGTEAIAARLVGVSSHTLPDLAIRKPEVASTGRIDVERLLGLHPDCILEAPGVLPRDAVERLERVVSRASHPIRILSVPMDSLGQIAAGYRSLGEQLGAASRGNELARAFEERIARLRGALRGVRVLVQVDQDPLVAVGGAKTFLSEALEHLGVVNVLAGIREAYPRISLEAALAANPDRIWILGEPENRARYERMVRTWRERLPSMKAVAAGRVSVILSRELTLPSFQLVEGLEKVVKDETR